MRVLFVDCLSQATEILAMYKVKIGKVPFQLKQFSNKWSFGTHVLYTDPSTSFHNCIMAASSTSAYRRLAVATIAVLFIISIVIVLFASNHHQPRPEKKKNEHTNNNNIIEDFQNLPPP